MFFVFYVVSIYYLEILSEIRVVVAFWLQQVSVLASLIITDQTFCTESYIKIVKIAWRDRPKQRSLILNNCHYSEWNIW